jgi:hypothetical protein
MPAIIAPERVAAMSANLQPSITDLEARYTRLPISQHAFAVSLCNQFRARGRLSPRQVEWVARLLDACTAAAAADADAALADAAPELPAAGVATMQGWLDSAAARGVLRPRVTYPTRAGGRLTFARPSSTSRYAGQPVIFVRRDREYAGMVRDLRFHAARDFAIDSAFTTSLAGILSAPLNHAVAQGHATGSCCFCSRQLTDARSVAHGYGPICAENYGLPWDAERTAARTENLRAAMPMPATEIAEPLPGLDAEDMEFMGGN